MSARCRAFLSLDRVNVPRIARIQSPLHDRFRSGLAWQGDFSSVHEAADGGLVCIVSRHSFGERPVAFLNADRNRFSLA